MKSKKTTTKPWLVPTGHRPHMTGGGFHDSRPRGQRNRTGTKRAAIDDSRTN